MCFYSKGAHCEFICTVLCPLTLRPLPCPFPRPPFPLHRSVFSASGVFISSFFFWTSLTISALCYPFLHFHCCHQVSACCFEFSATFEVGGERKKKNLHHWLMFKKKLFMTLCEDRLTSWCWHGWVLGCRLPPSPCVLTWQKGLGTSMLLLFSH